MKKPILMLFLSLLLTMSSYGQTWYMNGPGVGGEAIELTEAGKGYYIVMLLSVKSGFYFYDDSSVLGSSGEYLQENAKYDLAPGAKQIQLDPMIEELRNAFVTFSPIEKTLTIQGTVVASAGGDSKVFVSGDFNDWNVTDPTTVLENEPATMIYSGTVRIGEGSGTTQWMIYNRTGSKDKNCFGLTSPSSNSNQKSGTLKEGATNPVVTEKGNYKFWFNMATGMFELSKIADEGENLPIVCDPAINGNQNMYNSFTVTFNGYTSVALDPAMYNIAEAPGSFTDSEGTEVAKVGGTPLPNMGNKCQLTLSQTIFNQKFLNEHAQENPNEQYDAYADGVYTMTIPAGMITLYKGATPYPCEELKFTFNLGTAEYSNVSVTADPSSGTFDQLTSIRLSFSPAPALISVNPDCHEYISLVDPTGLGRVVSNFTPMVSGNQVILMLPEPYTAAGTYKVVVPARAFCIDDQVSREMTFGMYTITGNVVDKSIVLTPESMQVKSIDKVTVEYVGYDSVEVASSLADFETTGAYFSINGKNIPATVVLDGAFTLVVTPKEVINEAGVADLVIPEKTLTIDGGRINTNTYFTWEVLGGDDNSVASVLSDAKGNVYSITGVLLKENVSYDELLELGSGLYIYNKRKILVK